MTADAYVWWVCVVVVVEGTLTFDAAGGGAPCCRRSVSCPITSSIPSLWAMFVTAAINVRHLGSRVVMASGATTGVVAARGCALAVARGCVEVAVKDNAAISLV